jgi:dTDP-4-amino-4,6-dideoxygalactose transaminase
LLPVVDLSRRGARFAADFARAADRIARSGHYLLQEELAAFEAELAEAHGRAHAVCVSSGAAALQLALTGAGVGPGHDVLVPAFTAVPTASAVIAAGARPVFVDVDPATACVTPELLAAARTPATHAALVVHLYGFPAPVAEIDSSLLVIEDAAQSSGGRPPQNGSLASAFSFYPTKNLGGIGDGGAVLTDDAELATTVRRLRGHGMTEGYVHTDVSQNFRMSEIEAAWLRLGLPQLGDDVAARRAIAARYRAAAPHLGWQRADPEHAYHLCVYRSADRQRDRAALSAAGIATAMHYPLAMTQQPAYRHLVTAPCAAAEQWAAECVSVPCFPEMSEAEIGAVEAALAELPAYVQANAPAGR